MTDKLKNNKYKNESEAQNTLIQIRRLGNRITSQIVALQTEHRILRRPFILNGKDYMVSIQTELQEFEERFGKINA